MAWQDIGIIVAILGSIAIIFGFIVAMIVHIVKVARWSGQVDARLSGLENRMSGLENRMSGLEYRMQELSAKVDNLAFMMMNMLGAGKPPPTPDSSSFAKKSPITLSKKGVKMAEHLEANNTVEKFVNKIEVPHDASPFAIQRASEIFVFTRMMSLISPDTMRKIEYQAYEDGGDLNNVLTVYSILLRDKILEQHGLDVPEYDES